MVEIFIPAFGQQLFLISCNFLIFGRIIWIREWTVNALRCISNYDSKML